MKPKSLIGNFVFGQFYRLEISLFPYFMIRQKYEKFCRRTTQHFHEKIDPCN